MQSNVEHVRSVYVHVPFCAHRCPYCNFTLIAGRSDLHESYLRAIELELSGITTSCSIDTLFLGGGTPTALTSEQLDRLLTMLKDHFSLSSDSELSIEANPNDIKPELIRVLTDHGVNRVSLGVQSFDKSKLLLLGRDHDGDQIQVAMDLLLPSIASISVDLIFGTMSENLNGWKEDLRRAVSLSPHHLSTYGLTYEKGTTYWNRLKSGDLELVDEEIERQMYEHAIDFLCDHGFEHYEVSNFALPNHRCRHNQVYWTGDPFFALGPGAARFVNGIREVNHRSTTTYINEVLAGGSPVAEREELNCLERARERLVFGLRRLEGIDPKNLEKETGLEMADICGNEIGELVELGLLEEHDAQIRLSRKGLLVSDSIWPRLLVPGNAN